VAQFEALIAAALDDDIAPILKVARTAVEEGVMMVDYQLSNLMFITMILSERRGSLPPALSANLTVSPKFRASQFLQSILQISAALAGGDNAQLREAIDAVEAHGLIPHAARMRIVLAQRTGDRAQLERARPALERLGDKQFLQRLAEVEATLG
jgi:hypothetical protein